MDENPTVLLALVRNYLDITWQDAAGDAKLTEIIERGMEYINRIAGREQEYEIPGAAQGLLYNYCRYERANALHEFQRDYLHELLALQLAEGVSMWSETDADV